MAQPTIARYLLQRLQEAGIKHIFWVPGDYVLRFYHELAHSSIKHVGTTREDTAAFAADGYARVGGLGALAVTYGVGALNVVNAIAGAHAESSPVMVTSGAPGSKEQREDPMIHHRFGPFTFQREIFERITCATAVLDDPLTAFRAIDRTLDAARRYSSPVYIELPQDMVDAPGYPVPSEPWRPPTSDPGSLSEAIDETLAYLEQASASVMLAGVEIHRRGLKDELVRLAERAHLPVAATLTGKSVVGERHPSYLGVYEGAMGSERARRKVEGADVLSMLGVTLNDVDSGIHTAHFDPNHIVRARRDEVMIRHHRYSRVYLRHFMVELANRIKPQNHPWPEIPLEPSADVPRPWHD